MYTEAVQTCLEAKKKTTDKVMQDKLGRIAVDALERAETLKQVEVQPQPPSARNILKPLGNFSLKDGRFNSSIRLKVLRMF